MIAELEIALELLAQLLFERSVGKEPRDLVLVLVSEQFCVAERNRSRQGFTQAPLVNRGRKRRPDERKDDHHVRVTFAFAHFRPTMLDERRRQSSQFVIDIGTFPLVLASFLSRRDQKCACA